MTLQPRARRRRVSAALPHVVGVVGLCALGIASADDPWYVGIGGGASLLEPNSVDGRDVDEDQGTAATVFLGRDLDRTKSLQLQLHGLGEASFEDGVTTDYYAADASILYRFFDSRDRSRRAGGVALYGRFGLGYLERDSEAELEDDAPVWFGAGAGLEFMVNRTLAFRTEGLYLDTDAAVAYLSIVARFGGATRRPPIPRPSTPTDAPPVSDTPTSPVRSAPAAPAVPGQAPDPQAPDEAGRGQADLPPGTSAPRATDATTALADAAGPAGPSRPSLDDRDGDGVPNVDDVCLRSAAGFPVRDNGCALFDGVLSRVRFVDGGAELLPGAAGQLDSLADVLRRFPDSRIELHAHSDARGTARDQAIITRARLRTIGTYLVNQGISANRLVLRSFGGSRPVVDGTDAEAIERNNRIEVLENTR